MLVGRLAELFVGEADTGDSSFELGDDVGDGLETLD